MTTLIYVFTFVVLAFHFLKTQSQSNFTFNKFLTVINNDCYTRISIGSRLPETNATGVLQVENVSDCEEECSARRSVCKVFSFGIDIKGNATCILGPRVPQSEDLTKDIDYDVYIRGPNSPHCESDKLHISRQSTKRVNTGKVDELQWYLKSWENEGLQDFYFANSEDHDFPYGVDQPDYLGQRTDSGHGYHNHNTKKAYDTNFGIRIGHDEPLRNFDYSQSRQNVRYHSPPKRHRDAKMYHDINHSNAFQNSLAFSYLPATGKPLDWDHLRDGLGKSKFGQTMRKNDMFMLNLDG